MVGDAYKEGDPLLVEVVDDERGDNIVSSSRSLNDKLKVMQNLKEKLSKCITFSLSFKLRDELTILSPLSSSTTLTRRESPSFYASPTITCTRQEGGPRLRELIQVTIGERLDLWGGVCMHHSAQRDRERSTPGR